MGMKTAATALAAVLAAFAFGQSPSLAEVCEGQSIPTRAEYEGNAAGYADNFCALATYAPHRAARQFNSMVALVRAQNNPNRHYFDPKAGSPPGIYIQLLRPWMAEQNAAGTADWRTTRSVEGDISIIKVEDALAERHYFYVYVRPRFLEHDSYSPDNSVFHIRGTALRELCAFSESAPERAIWTAAELKQEFEYVLGDDGPNCHPRPQWGSQ